ncbi:AAA family ATPase [Nocardioides anomalus]|uniref:AAA family ATPase n=1 Tax=Nocardioides anomalus TaxID=2712223 RepID=A0A6G6W995_9ACTN|nr:ATP-binding protein [Nocardioides anomalus]QIG41792.1 AAA family ATPase [Nocardioides anomalus]
MDPVLNPYRPGAGRRPPVLAGRGPLLDSFTVVQRRAAEYGEGDRGWVLNGLRGVGKTVLLNEMQSQASARGWITAKVEATAGTPLSTALSHALVSSMRTATGRHPVPKLKRLLGVFKAFSLKFNPVTGGLALGADVDLVSGVADSGRFADDLSALFETLGETSRELGIGTLILVDELQEATKDELTAVNTAVHHLGQDPEPLPVTFVGAGLPSLPAQLADATSYAERLYDYRPVGLLSEEAAEAALVGPSLQLDVPWNDGAVARAMDIARGYPYFLQAVGKHVWDAARGPSIEIDDVEIGGELARREVDEGLYRSRWERATPAQKELLRALGDIGGEEPAVIGELVSATGKRRVSDLSVARNELIKKGLVYAPERGLLAFTVPGMSDFIARQP